MITEQILSSWNLWLSQEAESCTKEGVKCSGDGKEGQGGLSDSVAFELHVGKTRRTWLQ